MSTILKSLKKLEKEKEIQDASLPAPALITGTGVHQAIHRSVQFAWLKGRILRWSIVGAGSLLVLVVAIYAFTRPSAPDSEGATASKPIVQQVSKIKPQPSPLQPAPLEAVSSPSLQPDVPAQMAVNMPQANNVAPSNSGLPLPVSQRPDAEVPTAISPPVAPPPLPKDGFEALGQKPAPSTMGAVPVPRRQPQAKTGEPQTAQTPKPRSMPRVSVVSEETLSMGIAPVEPTLPVPADAAPIEPAKPASAAPMENKAEPVAVVSPSGRQPQVQPQPGTSSTPSKPETAAYAGAERMIDGALKVQAIVYAPAAEERMAVVNNTIVREGSAIERYTIVGIGEEDVFVREGQGRLLKVPFGKP